VKRFQIFTLGCKVNQYESQALREAWEAGGWAELPAGRPPAEADLILVNTCAVTAKAVADARAMVRRLNREAPQADILVSGCAAEAMLEEFTALPGVREVIGRAGKASLLRLPEQSLPGASADQAFPDFRISGYDRSRAVIKIQDGCSHNCTYCIVPTTRGKSVSRPGLEILAEAKRLLASGFREITLSGINLRQYKHDHEGRDGFWGLLYFLEKELAPEWAGRARLRISSLEPGQLGEQALEVLSSSRLVAPHLHLSLQSGSPKVLKRMGRGHYDPAAITSFLRSLHSIWPLFALGADLLTGFPGENEAEFEESLELCHTLPLSYAHVFPYSRRPGTVAATLPDQLPQALKKQRARILRQVVQAKQQDFLARLKALPLLQVVFEDPKETEFSPMAGERVDVSRRSAGTTKSSAKAKETTGISPMTEEGGLSSRKQVTASPTGGKQRPAGQNSALLGVCEYYVDCMLVGDAAGVIPRALTLAKPVKSMAGQLLVQVLPGSDSARDSAKKPGGRP
jgi:MiaB/RimO family radical SAM methylthiotransferase